MHAKVVCFWRGKRKRADRYFLTLHTTLDDVESYLTKLLFRAHIQTTPMPTEKRLSRIYLDQQRIHVRAVKIDFEVKT